MSESRLRLGEILVRAGLLDDERLQAALAEQKKWGGRLGRILVDLGFVDEPTIVAALSRHLHLPAVDLEANPPSPDAVQHLSVQICERYGVFPLASDPKRRTLRLATSDPTNLDLFRAIELKICLRVEPVVAGAKDIDKAIRRYYYGDVPSTHTAIPADFGLEEATFAAGPEPAAAAPDPAPAQPAVPAAATPSEVALRERVEHLEDLLSRQARALRALVEMLVEAGTLDRADYIKRVRGDGPP